MEIFPNGSSRRRISTEILALAWIAALIALFGPAEDRPVVLLLFPLPVYLLVAGSFVAWVEAPFMAAVALAAVCFVLSPAACFRRASRGGFTMSWLISLGLLGSWAFPIFLEFIASRQEKAKWGFDHAAWGYYLYAGAHTLAFVAIHVAPGRGVLANRQRGFAIVPTSGSVAGRPKRADS